MKAVSFTVLMGIFMPAWAQKNYYVVVGAFSTEENAKDFTTHLPSMNADTVYAMNDHGNVGHMYVLRTANEDVATEKALKIQEHLEQTETGIRDYESVSISNSPEGRRITVKSGIRDASGTSLSDASSSRSAASSASLPGSAVKPKGILFKFVISSPEGQMIPGKVHHVDFARERDLASYSASTYTEIINPGRNKDMALVCGIFGYKQTEKNLNYSEPSMIEGAFMDENGAWVVPYKLERLEKGDVSVMYNVAFHKDAVVMLPQSKTDLDELLNMMLENPEYEITIHGHCNGKNARKIIAIGSPDSFFDVSGSRQFFGTAKELSALRADAIRDYLTLHGIDEKRIRTFAWGGRYMLVEPTTPHAKLNDRIEIEIRKD